MARLLSLLLAVLLAPSTSAAVPAAAPHAEAVFSVYDYGARGDGEHNDTAAIQATINAAAASGAGGVAHLPENGTYLTGGGLNVIGHQYDGVTLRVDGRVTIPGPTAKPPWSTREQCGTAEHVKGSGGIPSSLCSVLLVMNVDMFTLSGHGSFTGFLFDEHSGPQPAGGNSFNIVNVTNVLVEGVTIAHFDGSMWIHFSQNIMVRNVTLYNRNTPEETGNIEVGGMGSHGVPPPLCAYKDGKFDPTNPCLAPGGNWQYELNLLRPTGNFTMRDSTVNGGDDNVCIKNDTVGVLVENVHFTDGHGASIGSIPDCYGCHGYVSDVVFRNCTFGGNAPMKIKTWANTTGEVSNVLFEDCTLDNAALAVSIGANYGTNACPCKWVTDYGGPGQQGECRSYGPTLKGDAYWPSGFIGLGGRCGPQGNASNTIAIRNITFRRLKGTVKAPGFIDCRKGNPCSVNFEDVNLKTTQPWSCGNADITSTGSVVPPIPECPRGPNDTPTPRPPPPPPPPPPPSPSLPGGAGCTVSLTRQESKVKCTAGQSYGCTGNATSAAVWVLGGCRGQFMCNGGGASHRSLECASDAARKATCPCNTSPHPPPPPPPPPPPGPPVPPRPSKRSVMIWFLGAGPDCGSEPVCNATGWEARIADMKAHSANFTAVSPPLYDIAIDGSFARIAGTGEGSYADLYPHVKELQAIGLEVHPLIGGPPNIQGQEAMIRNPKGFIDAAVAEAVRNGYTGYNFDNELRGKFTEASWDFLRGQGPPWVAFLDQFAEAMHTVNKTLSVDIEGCCGWVDEPRPLGPVGRCGGRSSVPWVGVFGAHEFLDATCTEFYASKVDWVYAMASYGTTINGPTEQPRGKYNYSYGPGVFKNITTAASQGLGPVYATGISGYWVWCKNGTLPETCVFDDVARSTIDWMLDSLGSNHIAHWVDEATSQATWDAWGYYLHRDH